MDAAHMRMGRKNSGLKKTELSSVEFSRVQRGTDCFSSLFFLVGPIRVRMPDEAGITESGLVGDFASEPGGNRELAVGRIKLDFRHDQPLVLPGELVDLPREIAERDVPAALDDDGFRTET